MSKPASALPAGKPAVLYLRRSTDRQEQSIADQRSYLERYAIAHSFAIVGEFVDDGISGTSADGRTGFKTMVEAAQAGPSFRFILCYSVSRFSRGDVDEAGYYRHRLRQAGVEVVYASENIQDEETEELVRPMLQTLARRESAQLSVVTVRGQMSAIAKGSYHGSTPCWGYDYEYNNALGQPYQRVRYLASGAKEVYAPDGRLHSRYPYGSKPPRADGDSVHLIPSLPERVETIRAIFRMYVQEGKGTRAIARALTERGILSPRCGAWGRTIYDGRWGITTIRAILTNQAYIGHTVWNKRTEAKFSRVADGRSERRPRSMSGKSRPNPRQDWVTKQNTHAPLVSREIFEAAQRILAGRDKSASFRDRIHGRGRTSNFLLSGLVRCSLCGNNFHGFSQKFRRVLKPAPAERRQCYLCGGYVNKGVAVCRRNAIEKAPFEEFVLGQVHTRLIQVLDDGGRKLLMAYVKEELLRASGSPEDELKLVEAQMVTLKAEADRLLASLTPVNREFIDERLIEIRGKRHDLESRKDALKAASGRQLNVDVMVEEAMGYLERFRDVLANGSFLERKEFVRTFVAGIDLDPAAKRGTLHMRNMVAASFCTTAWNRPKLYRRMRRFSIPGDFGRPPGGGSAPAPLPRASG